MATEDDVCQAIVGVIASMQPPGQVRLAVGWPNEQALDADIAHGIATITVFPDSRMQRNVTRYLSRDLAPLPAAAPGLIATSTETDFTFVGTPVAGQIATVIVPRTGVAASYVQQAGDTAAVVKAALLALLPAQVGGPVTSDAALLLSDGQPTPDNTLLLESGDPVTGGTALLAASAIGVAAGSIIVRIGVPVRVPREGQRKLGVFRVTIWAPDAATRQAIDSVVFQGLQDRDFISLPDQQSRARFESVQTTDKGEKSSVYRRDLLLSVEYASTVETTFPVATAIGVSAAPATSTIFQ